MFYRFNCNSQFSEDQNGDLALFKSIQQQHEDIIGELVAYLGKNAIDNMATTS
jgi:hypothetical protein